MELHRELEKLRKDIRSEESGVSIGEFISMYKDDEIDIHPKYQRFFRWSSHQKTRFIESILLGIPVPQIFVHQREDGVWDVVDGVQRLSTIYEFIGILKNEEGKLHSPLVLEEPELLRSLKGMKWTDPYDKEKSFDTKLQLFFKRAKLNVSIILRESGESVKYELFQRLNTGGSSLSDQEVRNCILVMENPDMYNWMAKLAEYDSFVNTVSISDKLHRERFDMELVLRFIIFKNFKIDALKEVRDVNKTITEKMIAIANNKDFNFDDEKEIFERTFSEIDSKVGANEVFKKYYPDDDRFKGGFILSAFEVIAYGLGYNIGKGGGLINRLKVCEALSCDDYINYSGSGKTVTQRLPVLLKLGRESFKK